jgi:hypothetical protein
MADDRPEDLVLARALLFWDYSAHGLTRAYLDCPRTVMFREVRKIEFADGGCLTFPLERSIFHAESLPKTAALVCNSRA